jgi:hypothetical protein
MLHVVFEEFFLHVLSDKLPLIFKCFTMVEWEMYSNFFVLLFNLLGLFLVLYGHEVVVGADKLHLGLQHFVLFPADVVKNLFL